MSIPVGDKSFKKGGKSNSKDPVQIAREKAAKARGLGDGACVFQLTGGKLRTHMIKNSCVAVQNGQHKAFRYVKGVKTIKQSEQGDLSGLRMEAIVFRKGKIVASDISLKDYLRAHPDNIENGGTVFYEYNAVTAADNNLKLELAKDEAKYMAAKGLDDDKAYLMAKHLRIQNIDVLSISEIRMFLRTVAEQNPELFNEMIVSPAPKLFSLLVDALTEGKVEFINNGKTLAYRGSQGSLLEVPMNDTDAKLDYVVRWMMSDEAGADFTKSLEA